MLCSSLKLHLIIALLYIDIILYSLDDYDNECYEEIEDCLIKEQVTMSLSCYAPYK